MKKIIIRLVRVLSVICIVLDIIGMASLFYVAHQYDALGFVIQKWQKNPFNFADSDIATINMGIIFLVVPILILSFVKSKREEKQKVQ